MLNFIDVRVSIGPWKHFQTIIVTEIKPVLSTTHLFLISGLKSGAMNLRQMLCALCLNTNTQSGLGFKMLESYRSSSPLTNLKLNILVQKVSNLKSRKKVYF